MYYSQSDYVLILAVTLFIVHWTAVCIIEVQKCKSRQIYSQIHFQNFDTLCKILEKTNEELVNVKEVLGKLKRKPSPPSE